MTSAPIVCPHCSMGTAVEFRLLQGQYLDHKIEESGTSYAVDYGYCQNPECRRLIIRLTKMEGINPDSTRYVLPRHSTRVRLEGIPTELSEDYEEACAVLDISPAASAALARRCLQGVIRGHFKINERRLYDGIKKVAGLKTLPQHLADGLDTIREIGNLAAHPEHDAEFGVIVRVSREEAEWTLEILEGLFRHCYVEPGEHERRTRKLREKMGRIGDKGKSQAQKGAPG